MVHYIPKIIVIVLFVLFLGYFSVSTVLGYNHPSTPDVYLKLYERSAL